MEKEENQNTTTNDNQKPDKETAKAEENLDSEISQDIDQKAKEEIKEPTPEEKITELEDKITRTFAEMENQRRRFEKEKEDAFEYGGYSFAKEALNLRLLLQMQNHHSRKHHFSLFQIFFSDFPSQQMFLPACLLVLLLFLHWKFHYFQYSL